MSRMHRRQVMAGVFAGVVSLLGWSPALGITVHVPAEFPSIQEAINAASFGWEIVVAPGTYTEDVSFIGKDLTLRSSGGAAVTRIAGYAGPAVAINGGESPAAVLEGFTITGGALVAWSRPTMRDCVFRSQTTIDNGSPTFIGCTFESVECPYCNGGALRLVGWTESHATFEGCVFSNNSADGGQGAAAFVADPGVHATFTGCQFTGNRAGGGGALCLRNDAQLTLRDCTFTQNHADWGGAVDCVEQPELTLEDCAFAENEAAIEGGAIRIWGNAHTWRRCTFTRNQADAGGAIMRSDDTALTFEDCTFAGNEARAFDGGAVRAGANEVLALVRCTFTDNAAYSFGGAVFTTAGCTLQVNGCTFTGNSANQGGAVLHTDGTLLAADATFDGNVANVGGGLRAWNAGVTVERCVFRHGGAFDGGGVTLSGCTEPLLRNCRFEANAGHVGGGLRTWDVENLSVEGCVFANNVSVDWGGGMHLSNVLGTLRVANCTMAGNTARSHGGGAWLDYDAAAVTWDNCVLWGNRLDATPSQLEFSCGSGGLPTVSYTDYEGGWTGGPGVANIDADPLFFNLPAGDCRLTAGSPCIDAGSNAAVPPGLTTDILGQPRISEGDANPPAVVDMGAYEVVDCNSNAVPDYQDLAAGTSTDLNGNSVPDECDGAFAYNVTLRQLYATIAEAFTAAANGHEIVATGPAFAAAPTIDFAGKALYLHSAADIDQPVDGLINLTAGARLAAAADAMLRVRGTLRTATGANADVSAGTFETESGATLRARMNSGLDIDTTYEVRLWGDTRIESGATLTLSGATPKWNNGHMTILDGGTLVTEQFFANDGLLTAVAASIVGDQIDSANTMQLSDTVLVANGLFVPPLGTVIGYGEFYVDISNSGHITTTADSLIVGDLFNAGGAVLKVQIGTTTLIGQLTNNGTIIGDFQQGLRDFGGTQPGDGLSIEGDYVAGPESTLLMANPVWRLTVAGDYDNAVNSNARFDMAQATLRLAGDGHTQLLEVMSRDIGPSPVGLDRTQPGRYPLHELAVGPTPAVVQLVDARDNDGLGQTNCEAIYADMVVIHAGTTLINATCKIYYNTLVNEGSVSTPANLVHIVTTPPICRGDGDCDGRVGFSDIDYFVAAIPDNEAAWRALYATRHGGGAPPCAFLNNDCTGDGHVNFGDIDPFVARVPSICP